MLNFAAKKPFGGLIRDNGAPPMIIDKPLKPTATSRPSNNLPDRVVKDGTGDNAPQESAGSAAADEEEIVDIKLSVMSDNKLDLAFSSHGKKHHLELSESHLNLENIPITLLGADENIAQQVKGQMHVSDMFWGRH